MLPHNQYKLTRAIRSLHWVFVGLLLVVSCLLVFFAFQWYKRVNSDIAFFITADGTYAGHKRPNASNIYRQDFELKNFASDFLEHAFSHNEYTLEDNINRAVSVMDRESGLYLLSKFDDSIEELYKKYNAVSTVKLEELEVNMKQYPYEVLLSYSTHLHFPKGDKVLKDSEVRGRLYFQVECLKRNKDNPYGMLIINFRFVDAIPKKNQKNK